MKKIVLLIFGIILNISICSQTLYKYDIEEVKSFQSGNDIQLLGLVPMGPIRGDDNEPIYPSSLCFDYMGRLNILDSINGRLIILDNSFNGVEMIKVSTMFGYGRVKHFENYIISIVGNYICTVYDKKNNKNIEIRMLNSLFNSNRYSFIFTGDIIFSKIDNDKFVSFVNPGDSYLDNIRNVLHEEDTLKLFKESPKYNLNDYTYKDGYILYKGDHIITSYKDYYIYWDEIHKKNNMKEPEMPFGVNFSHSELGRASFSYIGKDKNSYTYWQVRQSIYIFDDIGWVFEYFKVPKKLDPTTMWTLSPEGDLYALKTIYEERIHKLLRIKKQW